MEKLQERSGVLVEFADGTQILYDTDKKNMYSVMIKGEFETRFETEIDAVQYLLKCGYYKGDKRKSVIKK